MFRLTEISNTQNRFHHIFSLVTFWKADISISTLYRKPFFNIYRTLPQFDRIFVEVSDKKGDCRSAFGVSVPGARHEGMKHKWNIRTDLRVLCAADDTALDGRRDDAGDVGQNGGRNSSSPCNQSRPGACSQILFVCNVFSNAVTSPDYVASTDGMTKE